MKTFNKKTQEIELLRGFAILAVICLHTTVYFTKITNFNDIVATIVTIRELSDFAVPTFIFVSGFVLSLKYKGNFTKNLFYIKRAKSILPQYLLVSVVYLMEPLKILQSGVIKIPSLSDILFKIFSASSSGHLWFIAVIIELYLVYPYIVDIYSKFASYNKSILLLVIAGIIQESWMFFKSMIIGSLDPTYNIIINRIFFSHIFYFVFGIYVCQNYSEIKKKILKSKQNLLAISIILTLLISANWIIGIIQCGTYQNISKLFLIIPYMIAPIYYSLIFMTILAICISMSETKNNYSHFVLELGKYSFGIYLIHQLYVEAIVNIIFPKADINYYEWSFYPLLFISTTLLSYISIYIVNHLPLSEKIQNYFLLRQSKIRP